MKIVKDFYHDGERGIYVFSYRTEGLPADYQVSASISSLEYRMAGVRLESVWRDLRAKLMRRIEDALFKGEPR